MNQEKLPDFIARFEEFKKSDGYSNRKDQAAVIPFFRRIIKAAINDGPISSQTLTDLIQIQKHNCSDEQFDAKLTALIKDEHERQLISEGAYEVYQPGYTNAGKAAINGLSGDQLEIVRQFLLAAFEIQTIEAGAELCRQFEMHQIPEVKRGIYSPWLFYINHKIFPIINNTHKKFKSWLKLSDAYPVSMLEFNELNKLINEEDLGPIDLYAYSCDENGNIHFVEKLLTNGAKFYKMSHGIFTKNPRFNQRSIISVLEENNWICMGRYTGKGKGELFMRAKLGDIVYVCNGGDQLRYIGKIISEWRPLAPEHAALIDDDDEEFIYREVEVLYKAVVSDIRDLKSERSQIMPSGNSTFWEVPPHEFEYINEVLLTPKMNVRIVNNTGNTTISNITSEISDETIMIKANLNTILYGPPGTGKTYNSIDTAVSIIDGISIDHSAAMRRFNELKKVGQIEFITFHQNYSYEDFMVGLKPDASAEILRFEKRNGVFKIIVERARQNWEKSVEYLKLYPKSDTPVLVDFDSVFNSYFAKLIEEEIDAVDVQMRTPSYKFKITKIEFDTGKIKFTKQSGGTGHDLLIRNVKSIYNGELNYPQEGLGIYYYPLVDQLKTYSNNITQSVSPAEELRKYVLIIDEINRANISKVFGELITLIEEDKRLGSNNALTVTLPNDEKDFGVPPNLYIIGTMNTADKSIALVDVALRRRFQFVGYYPDYQVLAKKNSDRVELLRTINQNIYTRKKTADWLIGHAYFMSAATLKEILMGKVIPLLMEYFMGRVDEVIAVFEGTGWQVMYDTNNFNWLLTEQSNASS